MSGSFSKDFSQDFDTLTLPITETVSILTLPINCVLAGSQPEGSRRGIIASPTGILKQIFGE